MQTADSQNERKKRSGLIWKTSALIFLALGLVVVITLFWIYGTSTHHKNRESIWWSERGRNLIPPAATDITLQQDFLDHYATYTIEESQLNDFLDKTFAYDGKILDSFSERSPAKPENIGNPIGRMGWIVTEDTVIYSYAAGNGGVHTYYHDPQTGRTYQESAYW